MDSGVFGLLQGAVDKRADQGYPFYLDGDLGQMATQDLFLREHGFDVGRRDVYPTLRTEEDFKRALQLFWDYQADGWWGYDRKLIAYGICTQEEFDVKLTALLERRKR